MAFTLKSHGVIVPSRGQSNKRPYDHQAAAMNALSKLNDFPSFSTIVVLPTGGGKTYTAVNWLIKNAIGRHKKVLWIAHRHQLLDQAAQAFVDNSFSTLMPEVSGYSYRIISGKTGHQSADKILATDDLLIVSKDSLRNKLYLIEYWLNGAKEAYLVIDEAHHAAARSYLNLINMMKSLVPNLKIIGLTATPFRTLETEQGVLSTIFTDGIDKTGSPVKGDVGIAYQIGLQDLINLQILSSPHIVSMQTNESFGESLSSGQLKKLQSVDILPSDVVEKMVSNMNRNHVILQTYLDNRAKFGKTILFAVNIAHAASLDQLFKNAGVRSDYVASKQKDGENGGVRTADQNDAAIREFRDGDLEVIINVNILTEGVDLPKTQTVFLARPTTSTILMTQMIGRALRGLKAGGTRDCYIVTFVDGWSEQVAWANPATLYTENPGYMEGDSSSEDASKRATADIRSISISDIREFAQLLEDTIEAKELKALPFIELIPLGMYLFSYTEQGEGDSEGNVIMCRVMVHSSTKDAYDRFLEGLPDLASGMELEEEEYASEEQLAYILRSAKRSYFHEEFVPPCSDADILSIVKYFIQFNDVPPFYLFDEIDRNRLDVGVIAKHIMDEGMNRMEESEYVNQIWNEGDDNLLRQYFGSQMNFISAIENEEKKIMYPHLFEMKPQVIDGDVVTPDGPTEPIDVEPIVESEKPCEKDSSWTPIAFPNTFAHLDTDTVAKLDEYESAQLAMNPVSNKPFKRFGGKARLHSIGNNEFLYSFGYMVAQRDPEGHVLLFEFAIDDVKHGWRFEPSSPYHAIDFASRHLSLESGKSIEELELLAASPSSKLEIRQLNLGSIETKDKPITSQNGQSTEFTGASENLKLGDFAASADDPSKAFKSSNTSDEPPTYISQEQFASLDGLRPTGYINERASRPFRTFNGKARIMWHNGCEYLYGKRRKIACWNQEEGLTLYEYQLGRGWSEQTLAAYSRDFAVRKLNLHEGLRLEDLRKMAADSESFVRIQKVYKTSANDPLSTHQDALDETAENPEQGKTTVSKRAKPKTEKQLLKTLPVNNGYYATTVQISNISTIHKESVNTCSLRTAKGARYSLFMSLEDVFDMLPQNRFAKIDEYHIVNLLQIGSVRKGDEPTLVMSGYPTPIPLDKSVADRLYTYASGGRISS